MCGRFSLTADVNAVQEKFPWVNVPPEITPRYNIAPTQPVAVVANDGKNQLDYFTWGLIPSWAKDPAIGNRMINARAETLTEKPAFRSAFRRRRCLILADGFYEWQQLDKKTKVPMYFRLSDGTPFAFGGLWEVWQSPDGSVIHSCTIITTDANDLVAPIHNRMPFILPETVIPEWLQAGEGDPKELMGLIKPYPAGKLQVHPVSTLVNSPANDVPAVITPVN